MPAWLLIALFSVFFLATFPLLIRRDDLVAVFYACLFIYTLFTQIGYGAFPYIAIRAGLYFGRDSFVDYWWFVSLSFGLIFILLWVVVNTRGGSHQSLFRVEWRPLFISDFLLYVVGGAFITYVIYYVLSNQSKLTYVSLASSEGGQLFAFASAMLDLLTLTYYVKFRRYAYSRPAKVLALAYCGVCLLFLVFRLILTGERTLIVSQFMAIVAFELVPFKSAWKKDKKKLIVFGVVAALSAVTMLRVVLIRGLGDNSLILFFDPTIKSDVSSDVLESVVRQDYFSPSISLMASMYDTYVDPAEVIRSNFNNSLAFQNYPYLSETVGRLLGPTTRKQGSAYFILTEGYNFAGWWGVIYNGVVIVVLLAIWRRIRSSDSEDFNRFMTAIMISLMIPMVRGQTSYFLKNIYMFIVPAALMFYLASGWLPTWRIWAYNRAASQMRWKIPDRSFPPPSERVSAKVGKGPNQ